MNFSDLQLESSLTTTLTQIGFNECTPIQEQAMPHILAGKDVAGLAQTGTGKTAAFVLPLMERILRARPVADDASEETRQLVRTRAFTDWKPFHFILVLVPTRELAEQVFENVQKFGQHCGLKGTAIYGGTGYDKQKEAIKNGVEFVVATPGRLIDLFKENIIDLKQVRAVVFDEADRMFDMGFKDDMKYILQRIPRERQLLVFSATLNFDVLNTVYQFGSEPVEINISRDQAKAENVKDAILHVGQDEKPQFLFSLMKLHQPKQAIIFTNFKVNVDKIAKFLNDNDLPAMAISSLLTQAQRTRVIEQFKADNNMNIMVATDVAARGLDIKGVDMVINFELPNDSESYVHRIGRTGRAGTEGKAFSLVSDRDIDALYRLEEYLKHKLESVYLENDQLIKEFKPYPEGDFSYSQSFRRHENSDQQGKPRRHDRKPRRDKPQRGEQASGERGERPQRRHGAHKEKNHEHRHQQRGAGQNQHAKNNSERDQSPRHGHKGHQHKGKTHSKHGQQHTHGHKPKHAVVAHKKQQSIGQKISGFFKKLFS